MARKPKSGSNRLSAAIQSSCRSSPNSAPFVSIRRTALFPRPDREASRSLPVRYNAARDLCQAEPRTATAWYLLGESREHEKQTQAAIVAWKQALSIEPSNSRALWSLARALKPAAPNEAARLLTRYSEVLKERHIVNE